MGDISNINKKHKEINVTIRTAHSEDSRQMIELIKTIDCENRYMIRKPGEYEKNIEEMEQEINKVNMLENSLLAVAEVESKIVGYIKFEGKHKERIKHKGEFSIGISKNYCGQGIGSFLLEEMLEWCKKIGITKVELKVAEENKRGIELYKKYGFKIVGKLEKDLYLGKGEYLDFLLMDKII
jgi:ribosomal protein S18 acetylase RimI-like enzyme